jgi:hypothetical protein
LDTNYRGELLFRLGVDLGVDDVQVRLRRAIEDGAKARGPHYDAQKSTSAIGLSMIVDSKSTRVRLVVGIDLVFSNTLWCSVLGDRVGVEPGVVAAFQI